MSVTGQDTLKTRRTLNVGGKEYDYFSLKAAEAAGLGDVGAHLGPRIETAGHLRMVLADQAQHVGIKLDGVDAHRRVGDRLENAAAAAGTRHLGFDLGEKVIAVEVAVFRPKLRAHHYHHVLGRHPGGPSRGRPLRSIVRFFDKVRVPANVMIRYSARLCQPPCPHRRVLPVPRRGERRRR